MINKTVKEEYFHRTCIGYAILSECVLELLFGNRMEYTIDRLILFRISTDNFINFIFWEKNTFFNIVIMVAYILTQLLFFYSCIHFLPLITIYTLYSVLLLDIVYHMLFLIYTCFFLSKLFDRQIKSQEYIWYSQRYDPNFNQFINGIISKSNLHKTYTEDVFHVKFDICYYYPIAV